MTSVIQLYEELSSAPDKTRARVIAEAFERMEERCPEVKDLATQSALTETELRLQKEIEIVRKEIVAMEGRLAKELEQARGSGLRWVFSLLAGQTVVIIAALFAIAGN
ncbi:hypothetical protein [Thiohalomonas denitrificans]|uniref:DUF1640 domain-containing protein n=1 Tax=Thiohalomonas denitrificans TaxID=415747 RepID=A0A1G5QZQ3_9GAMM|nr:hypothetical protein [Thiohalomonas denitrificans]SCZ67207.1 hypothetical protein SAMN03097708_03096 [Thiohalomonas denitrificans]